MPGATQEELAIHQRVVNKDPTAFAILSEKYLSVVTNHLKRKNPKIARVDRELIYDTVIDSFVKYLDTPQKFNPSLKGLLGFLIMDTQFDLQNEWTKRVKRSRKTKELVENPNSVRNNTNTLSDSQDPHSQLVESEAQARVNDLIERVFKDPVDRELASMVLSSIKKTKDYAIALGIEHLPIKEQRQQIKRHKDRIKKQLERGR